ncbi:MAG: glycosyltransferase family 1 protein [Verrucomicrobiota bacterium]
MKIALSILCENPLRKTGLTSLFHEFVRYSLAAFENLEWIVFAGPEQEWEVIHPRVEVVKDFAANNRLRERIVADHFLLPPRARALGAEALVTVGFVPLRKSLPTVMHMLSLQHLDHSNKVGTLRQGYRRWMAGRGFEKADAILTNSEFARAQILAQHPECASRLTLSYEGLQHDQFHPFPDPAAQAAEAAAIEKEFGLRPGYLLWVSNFYPYKQAELLLEGYARLNADARARMPLVMVGGGWEGGDESAGGRARTLGIEKDVRFMGWVADQWVPPLFRHARVFTLPSREETFGRCVLEAMACGIPCVVNDIPIMHEVTAEHAAIVDFNDPMAVADALRRMMEDGPEREKLRLDGLRRAADFSFDKLARERIAVIRQVIESGKMR